MKYTHSFSVASNGLSQVRGLHQHPLIISWALQVRNPGTGSARCQGEVSVSAGRIPLWNPDPFPSSSCGQKSALCNWGTETPVLSRLVPLSAQEAASVLCHLILSESLHASNLRCPQSLTFIPDLKGLCGQVGATQIISLLINSQPTDQ